MFNSPLRYPGGKSLMAPFFLDLFKLNNLSNITYVEPYAGGAGAALNLLFSGGIERIWINDANIGVFSFWHTLINESQRFIQTLINTPVTLEEWKKQKAVVDGAKEPSFELGFATFFLSRTNRSGVITAGPIGGNNAEKQLNANYKIDCRYNKDDLVERLSFISKFADRIKVTNMDALDLLHILDTNVFVYLDPPYYVKGKCLYMNHYTHEDHKALADYLQNEAAFCWVLSYDDVPAIRSMYSERELYRFPLSYTVQDVRKGMELFTHSNNIVLPENPTIRRQSSKDINLIKITNRNIMSEVKIERIGADKLHFDLHNPRLVEFVNCKNETEILNILWSNMAVNELVMSILANGFFPNEAMYVVKESGKLVVVEGNRRLAAVKAILSPDIIKNGGMNKYLDKITDNLRNSLSQELPVVVLNNREEAWRFIGFKHVNGAAKWDSYAKAEYIAQVHNNYGISLEDIASQIGDSNQITQKLYQGLMVLNQADRETDFKKEDVYNKRIYFSHVYTSIMYSSMQEYLGLNLSDTSNNPVPQSNLKKLEEVMFWLLGSKKRDLPPVVKSQNPGIRQLCQVLESPDAIQYLRIHNDLEMAYDWSQDGLNVFHESLVAAQSSLQKAMSKISYYDGGDDLLRTAMDMANTADDLFKMMKDKKQSKVNLSNKRTLD